jgi:rfaE bifunctional protein kinase chain/domain
MAFLEPEAWTLLCAMPGKTIVVLGDVILDEYVTGEVRGISAEAPVPVVDFRQRTFVPGGAANVAANLAAWGCRPLLAGVAGTDDAAQHLSALQAAGVAGDGILLDPKRPTTVKTRILAQNQQIVRLDRESREPIPVELESQLLHWTESVLAKADACILADYGKGVVTPRIAVETIKFAKKAGVPVLVDPKSLDLEALQGATVVKPNKHEAERLVNAAIHNEASFITAGQDLARRLPGSSVVITRGPEGMSLFRQGHPTQHVVAAARIIFDVTGAGDTVISMLAAALAAQASLEEAMWLASHSAAVVVGKRGTATLTLPELQAVLENQ